MKVSTALLIILQLHHQIRSTVANQQEQTQRKSALRKEKRVLDQLNNYEADSGPVQIGDHHDITISSVDALSDILPNTIFSSEGTAWKSIYEIHHKDASYLSVHFRSVDLPPDCSLTIASPPPSMKESATPEDKDKSDSNAYLMVNKGRHEMGTFWGRHVDGDTVNIILKCEVTELGNDLFEVDQYVAGYATAKVRNLLQENDERFLKTKKKKRNPDDLEAICSTDDRGNAVCYKDSHPIEYEKARAVARLFINGSGACTGYLVSDSNVLITNQHCVDSQSDAVNTDYEFMGEEETCDSTAGDCRMCQRGDIYDGLKLIAHDKKMDFALIMLDGDASSKYGYLEFDNRRAIDGEEIYIPQHPHGRAKEMAIFDTSSEGGVCRVLGYKDSCKGSSGYQDVSYMCDTESGSSGSPVLARDSHKVIALHHCGGGCGGNLAVPVTEFYDAISPFLVSGYTIAPTPAPTSLQCDENFEVFKLDLKTDEYTKETWWELTEEPSGKQVLMGDEYEPKSENHVENCVEKGCYKFTIHDRFGDGICCNFGFGSYDVIFGTETFKGGVFTKSDSAMLGCGDAPVAPPTSVMPTTPSPTVTPTTPFPTVTPTTAVPTTPSPTPAPNNDTPSPVTEAPVTPSPTPAPATPSPTEKPSETKAPTPCERCTDEPAPWMAKNGSYCNTFKSLVLNNCVNNDVWVENKYCQYSCYKKGVGYPGDVCCEVDPEQ